MGLFFFEIATDLINFIPSLPLRVIFYSDFIDFRSGPNDARNK